MSPNPERQLNYVLVSNLEWNGVAISRMKHPSDWPRYMRNIRLIAEQLANHLKEKEVKPNPKEGWHQRRISATFAISADLHSLKLYLKMIMKSDKPPKPPFTPPPPPTPKWKKRIGTVITSPWILNNDHLSGQQGQPVIQIRTYHLSNGRPSYNTSLASNSVKWGVFMPSITFERRKHPHIHL